MVKQQKSPLWRRVLRLADQPGDTPVESEYLSQPKQKTAPIGSPGTEIYQGYVAEEYLTTLRGHERANVYDKIRRSDPQAKMCLSAVKLPLRKAKWSIQPADADSGVSPEDAKADADLIEQILFRDISWKRTLNEALTMIEFGVAPFEVTHKVVLDSPRFGSYISLRQLGWRSPRTIHRYNVDPETQCLKSLTQYAYGDLEKTVDIPAEYLLMMVLDMEGANYEGISALRPCYGNWFRKNVYQKLNAIGIERSAVKTPLGKYPPGQEKSESYSRFVEVLESYCSHQSSYITLPNDWGIELVGNDYDPSKTETSIENEDKRMVKAFLANFLELGMNGSGSYALSNDISDFFLSSLDHVADLICEPINLQLIPSLIRLNRGPRAAYPTLKASGISDKAGKELAEVFEILARGGYVTATDEPTREHVRERFGLPKPAAVDAAALPPTGGAPLAPAPSLSLSERVRIAREAKAKSKA